MCYFTWFIFMNIIYEFYHDIEHGKQHYKSIVLPNLYL